MKKIGDKDNYTNSILENIKNVDEYWTRILVCQRTFKSFRILVIGEIF